MLNVKGIDYFLCGFLFEHIDRDCWNVDDMTGGLLSDRSHAVRLKLFAESVCTNISICWSDHDQVRYTVIAVELNITSAVQRHVNENRAYFYRSVTVHKPSRLITESTNKIVY